MSTGEASSCTSDRSGSAVSRCAMSRSRDVSDWFTELDTPSVTATSTTASLRPALKEAGLDAQGVAFHRVP
jgi:hypothetical protein